MSACAQLHDRLLDHALGEPVTPALAEHLQRCEGCARELERRRALAQRIDAGVRRIMSLEPTPYVAHASLVAADGTAARRKRGMWTRTVALGGLAACLAGFIAFCFFKPTAPRDAASVSALTQWRSPTRALLAPLGDAAFNVRPEEILAPAPGLRLEPQTTSRRNRA